MQPLARLAWLLLALTALGCDDLDDFRTDGDVFRGRVNGESSDVFREGFSPRTFLELEFDPELAEGRGDAASSPGVLHTYTCDDGSSRCDAPVAGPIERAPLERFPVLAHDLLSDYTFPGASRLRNYILSVRRSDDDPGSAMVFISLMEDGGIEVRVMAPGAQPGAEGLFGVFPLSRQDP